MTKNHGPEYFDAKREGVPTDVGLFILEANEGELWSPGHGVCDPEGPYPDIDINARFRWLQYPSCEFEIDSFFSGTYKLIFTVQNRLFPEQKVTVSYDGDVIGVLTLRCKPGDALDTVIIERFLDHGLHKIVFSFARGVGQLALRFDSLSVCLSDALDPARRKAGNIVISNSVNEFQLGWIPIAGIGPEEGPFVEQGIMNTFRWLFHPAFEFFVSVQRLHCYELTFSLQNRLFEEQQITVFCDGTIVERFRLGHQLGEDLQTVVVRLLLHAGEHRLFLTFDRGFREGAAVDGRVLALRFDGLVIRECAEINREGNVTNVIGIWRRISGRLGLSR